MENKTNQPTSTEEKNVETKATANNNSKKSKKKVAIIVIILLLLMVIGALGAVIYQLMQDDKDNGDETTSNGVPSGPKRNTVVTMDNKDEILADLNNKVANGMLEVKMNVDWSFKNSSTPSENAYVANKTTNNNTFYFDVVVDATGETVYESPYIPVGSELRNIELTADLSAGTYPCTLTYHLIDDNYEDVSSTSVAVTLHVSN